MLKWLSRASCLVLALFALNGAHAATSTKAHANPVVKLTTSLGVITLELDQDKAPITVANFVQYVKEGFYNGTVFHRVIGNFMIQGGGYLPNLQEKKTHAPIQNEAANGLTNDAYTIAMARTSDPQSASAQFFINVVNNPFLNYTSPTPQGYGYAVFGHVISGQDVVDKIKAVPTGSKNTVDGMPMSDVPVTDVVIKKAELVKPKK